ncbi:MAG: hypothetical protein QE494_09810 [Ramlibacter sp.]|nr:hypothetical protein [Ramlibacter sp.]MDH4376584.1 hypothetical protein [Ramlibacter sp.]
MNAILKAVAAADCASHWHDPAAATLARIDAVVKSREASRKSS